MLAATVHRTGIILVAVGAWFTFDILQTRTIASYRGFIFIAIGAALIFIGRRLRRKEGLSS